MIITALYFTSIHTNQHMKPGLAVMESVLAVMESGLAIMESGLAVMESVLLVLESVLAVLHENGEVVRGSDVIHCPVYGGEVDGDDLVLRSVLPVGCACIGG